MANDLQSRRDPVRFLLGESIYLRPLRQEDLEGNYLSWLNDPEVTAFMDSGILPYSEAQLRDFVAATAASSSTNVLLAIVDRRSDAHMGNVKLGPIDWIHRKATFGILVGEREFWGRGICREATALMVRYAFRKLGLNRVDLGVVAEHTSAIRCYEQVGFRREGVLRESQFRDGAFLDTIWMAILSREFEAVPATGSKQPVATQSKE